MSGWSEIWAPVAGFEGLYDVSAEGEIMRVAAGRKGATPGRILRGSRSGEYPSVVLTDREFRTKTHLVHALVARAFLGPRPKGAQVNHKDGVKSNNRLGNLEYVTPKQNIAHAKRLGLAKFPYGIALQSRKLTDEQVREIRRRRPAENAERLAAEFGISRSHVYSLCNGNSNRGGTE